jgi:hypothetical protein
MGSLIEEQPQQCRCKVQLMTTAAHFESNTSNISNKPAAHHLHDDWGGHGNRLTAALLLLAAALLQAAAAAAAAANSSNV